MFRKDLKEKLQQIFLAKKVTFDLPADEIFSDLKTPEQEILYVDVTESKTKIKDAVQTAKVTGIGKMYGPADSLTYGFFEKRIQQAGYPLTNGFFFYNVEQNKGRIGNVIERTFSFVYFYSGQYDPEVGTITSIDFEGI
jgi:hypothetical protein